MRETLHGIRLLLYGKKSFYYISRNLKQHFKIHIKMACTWIGLLWIGFVQKSEYFKNLLVTLMAEKY